MNLAHPAGSGRRGLADFYLRVSTVALQAFSIVVLAAMTGINTLNICARALFRADFEWTQEVLMIGAMGIYFLSVALIAKGNIDIRIDAVLRLLPAAWQRALGLAARVGALVFQCLVLWLALDTWSFVRVFRTPVLEFSEAIFFIPVILGAADMAITEAIYLVRQCRGEIGPPGTGLA